MEFSITALSPETAKAGCVVVGVHSGKELTPPAKRIDQASRGALRNALPDLQEKTGSTLLLRGLPGVAAERVLLVSLGARKEFGASQFRDAVRAAAVALRDLPAKDAALFLVETRVASQPLHWNVRHAVIGVRDAFYRFDEMKSQKKNGAASLQDKVRLSYWKGWGDCQAGCIYGHTWFVEVTPEGNGKYRVELLKESGSSLENE